MFQPIDNQRMSKADGNAEMIGDILQLVAAETVHFQGDAGPFGQFGHRRQHGPDLVFPRGLRLGRRPVLGGLLRLQFRILDDVTRLPDLLAAAVNREIAHNAIEVADRFFENPVIRRRIEAQIGLLHDVFRARGIADDTAGVIQQFSTMGHEETQGPGMTRHRSCSCHEKGRRMLHPCKVKPLIENSSQFQF